MIDFLFSPAPILALQRIFGPEWFWVFWVLSLPGASFGVLFALAFAFWVRGRDILFAVLLLAAIGGAVTVLLWVLIGIPRPDAPGMRVYADVPSSSFPSGHLVTATALWGTLAMRGLVPVWLALVIVPLVAVTRLYLGVHYLADLFAGVAIGFALLAFVRWVWPGLVRLLARVPFWAFAGLAILASIATLFGGSLMSKMNAEAWATYGALVMGPPSALVEYRLFRYTPVPLAHADRTKQLVIGLVGLLVPVLLALALTGGINPPLWGLLIAFGAIWALVIAPWIFIALNLGASERGTGEGKTA